MSIETYGEKKVEFLLKEGEKELWEKTASDITR